MAIEIWVAKLYCSARSGMAGNDRAMRHSALQVARTPSGFFPKTSTLIEKAVKTAVSKALAKVDDFIDRATTRVDEAIEKACNQLPKNSILSFKTLSMKLSQFSERLNELQSSIPAE
ncbi:hypothetical protein TSTA_038450 [Talaromyces stipitatus ATCC 10500]|uniref:Uncharacterized protein n=1 Tax=Talaromyces stipitatus (strain ATCC 10500 / CBS 375.48 / QM 6759 / NRRL 1006) TaxID=441959 RepID=B8M8X6_TALSN|nr:uncharacterized protein TSTA_038450 [Talaromyces stipitatus ATCC 10500]EED20639.1 hypothetical protein TSTA_038450 [Talaromyces stipitatus ATCC 10500]